MNTVKVRNITIGEGRPKICVPIVGKTREEILKEASTFSALPVDVAEWRVDWYDDVFDTEEVLTTAKQLNEALGEIPVLFTFRTSKEGGEKEISLEQYAQLNKAVAESGYVDLVDVEAFTGDEIVTSIISHAHANGVKVIASNHDFVKTPEKDEIVRRLRKMQTLGTGVVSRLTGETFGSALTFGAASKASAPGQIGVHELKQVLDIIHKSL